MSYEVSSSLLFLTAPPCLCIGREGVNWDPLSDVSGSPKSGSISTLARVLWGFSMGEIQGFRKTVKASPAFWGRPGIPLCSSPLCWEPWRGGYRKSQSPFRPFEGGRKIKVDAAIRICISEYGLVSRTNAISQTARYLLAFCGNHWILLEVAARQLSEYFLGFCDTVFQSRIFLGFLLRWEIHFRPWNRLTSALGEEDLKISGDPKCVQLFTNFPWVYCCLFSFPLSNAG